VVCKDALKGVSAADRRVVFQGGIEEATLLTSRVRALTGEVMDQFRKEGIHLLEVTPEERAGLREITRPTHDTFRKSTTPAGRELLAAIEGTLRDLRTRRQKR
jgi:TRAP-type C4-dicarboxylate transport system substrate-binding protein